MKSIFNNIWPAHVNFTIHDEAPVVAVPMNQPQPHYSFPPTGGYLPGAAVPSKPPGNLKAAISKLPSLFNINNGNS